MFISVAKRTSTVEKQRRINSSKQREKEKGEETMEKGQPEIGEAYSLFSEEEHEPEETKPVEKKKRGKRLPVTLNGEQTIMVESLSKQYNKSQAQVMCIALEMLEEQEKSHFYLPKLMD